MDLQPASSLLSPLSRVLIHTETSFILQNSFFSLPPVLIYRPDHDIKELKEGGGGRRRKAVRVRGMGGDVGSRGLWEGSRE